ncbi:hypothetical protein [Bradyrhizobium lablabi]|uniref:hypothetical protein n=1 Tax=Bradyrhizobium lablabi TaxID=722472 RepID=UPI001BA95E05|nr:hypothetical protein [Bradyrhizobium lablabi]MBR0692910.1 hypothetical protein [Bradyrhizobium lablabi]
MIELCNKFSRNGSHSGTQNAFRDRQYVYVPAVIFGPEPLMPAIKVDGDIRQRLSKIGRDNRFSRCVFRRFCRNWSNWKWDDSQSETWIMTVAHAALQRAVFLNIISNERWCDGTISGAKSISI